MPWFKIFESIQLAKEAFKTSENRRVNISNTKVCLSYKNDVFYAIEDKCPHSMASLSDGKINNFNEIVCPLHAYCYNLKTGREKDQKTKDAIVYEVKVTEKGLFINFEE